MATTYRDILKNGLWQDWQGNFGEGAGSYQDVSASPEYQKLAQQEAQAEQFRSDPLYAKIEQAAQSLATPSRAWEEGVSAYDPGTKNPFDMGSINALYQQVKAGGTGLDVNSDWNGLMQNMANKQYAEYGNWSRDSAQVVPKFFEYNGLDPNRIQINKYLASPDYADKQGKDDYWNAADAATPTGGFLGWNESMTGLAAAIAGGSLASMYGGGLSGLDAGMGAWGDVSGASSLVGGSGANLADATWGANLRGDNMGFFDEWTDANSWMDEAVTPFNNNASGANGWMNEVLPQTDFSGANDWMNELSGVGGSPLSPSLMQQAVDSGIPFELASKMNVSQLKSLFQSVLGGGSGAGGTGSLGSSIFDQITNNPLQSAFNATPFLLALQQANAQKNSINPYLSGINNLAAQSQGNNSAYMKAITDPYNAETGRGMNVLNESLTNRGVAGSSFGDQSVTNYNLDRSLGLGDLTAKAQQGSMGLTAGLFNQGATLQNAANTNTNLLLGAGLNASGQLFGKQNDPNAWMANLFKAAA